MLQEINAFPLNVRKHIQKIEAYVFQDMKKGRRQIDICATPFLLNLYSIDFNASTGSILSRERSVIIFTAIANIIVIPVAYR